MIQREDEKVGESPLSSCSCSFRRGGCPSRPLARRRKGGHERGSRRLGSLAKSFGQSVKFQAGSFIRSHWLPGGCRAAAAAAPLVCMKLNEGSARESAAARAAGMNEERRTLSRTRWCNRTDHVGTALCERTVRPKNGRVTNAKRSAREERNNGKRA